MTDQQVYDRLREVETATSLNGVRLEQLKCAQSKMENEKIDPMRQQVDELHTTMTRNKGFVTGLFVMAGAVWTAVAGVAVATWKLFSGDWP